MLISNKCSAIVSIKVELTYDDGRQKERVLAVGDLVDIDFNYNGLIKHTIGRILKIYAEGSDPKNWLIILDCSDGFDSVQYRFSPVNIIDVEILKKMDAIQFVESTNDYTNIRAIRFVHGRIQVTQDGIHWLPIVLDAKDIIYDEEGTVPVSPRPLPPPIPAPPASQIDDEIRDEVNG